MGMMILAGIGLSTEVIKVLTPALLITMVLISIALIILILRQDGNTNQITGINTSSNNDTQYGKNKSRTKATKLKIATLILSACLLIVSILYFLFKLN